MPDPLNASHLEGVQPAINADWAFRRYQEIRPFLPKPVRMPQQSIAGQNLMAVVDHVDGFIFDAFGVLNVGDTAIAGAPERLAALRRLGKSVTVLTNAASYPRAVALEKYRRFGFDFSENEVVSSRDVASAHLARVADGAMWAALSQEGDDFADIPADVRDAIENPALLEEADAFLFLSSNRWTADWQERLHRALKERPRPIVIANPDLVAPRENGLSVEPGTFGFKLADELPIEVHFHGKPFHAAFDQALLQMELQQRERVAMIGDTLHTDILGGLASGLATVLITSHGMFKGCNVDPYIAQSGIMPDFILTTT